MVYRTLCAAGAFACALAVTAPASAATSGVITGNVHMRTGPSVRYQVITTVPAGAPVEIFGCDAWCHIAYRGREGYVSGNYVGNAYAEYSPQPRYYYRPAPPPPVFPPYFGYYGDYGHHHHRHRYRHGDSGFYFGFGF